MILLLTSLAILLASGLAALAASKSVRACSIVGAGGTILGCLVGLVPALQVLRGAAPASMRVPWEIPYGEFYIEIDPLSAFFLIPIFGLSAIGALYGADYLWAYKEKKVLGLPWLFYPMLVATMALVVVAKNGMLFLFAWEGMALSSFFLVMFENEVESVRQAGWTYLVATHLGTAFLLPLFLSLAQKTGSMNFDAFASGSSSGLLFLLAVVGFGTKAGLMPMHIWLPEAHPAAPSHVSAVLSGAMIKTGLYGLVRFIDILGTPAPWWGWVLIGLGTVSGVVGVLFAIAQKDIKRMLAYSSVENIGIITLGLGVGVLG
jgi:formate hydrogenlyase subunit 3/multisubunit Na+/H+ antiporter MnhD subunit